jgi:hypothetical protein
VALRTVTFYSYKGGVGRTMVVANCARYLARFGQKVFAIDFDLEAPGLHYKLGLSGPELGTLVVERGLVDYLHPYFTREELPASLAPFTVEIPVPEVETETEIETAEEKGSIRLLPAGAAPSPSYWQKLARLNWHELFYAEDAPGVLLFLELKERIAAEFAPDILLIDSRTGITEVGGVTTTLLADQVVCLLLNNAENLEGAREVLRSIRRAPRLPGQAAVEILPVLTRIPEGDEEAEHRLRGEVRDFLNREADDLASTLAVPEVLVFHSDPDLQRQEALQIGGPRGIGESVLLRDHLRLFSKLLPLEALASHQISVRSADLTLVVLEHHENGRAGLQFWITDHEANLDLQPSGSVLFAADLGRYLEGLFRDFEKLREDRGNARERANALGENFCRAVLPPSVRDFLSTGRQRIRSIHLLSQEISIPWEICKLSRDEGRSDDDDFLCEAFAMTRWPLGRPRQSSLRGHHLAVITSQDIDLPGAQKEHDFLRSLSSQSRMVKLIPARHGEVLEAVLPGDFSILHFSGHGSAQRAEERPVILLQDQMLSPTDLAEARFTGTKPLVFLNSSGSARAGQGLAGTTGWAHRFLDSGAAAFLGSYWDIQDASASLFSRAFYARIFAGLPLGEAVRQARLELRQADPDDFTRLAYTLFADPQARIIG